MLPNLSLLGHAHLRHPPPVGAQAECQHLLKNLEWFVLTEAANYFYTPNSDFANQDDFIQNNARYLKVSLHSTDRGGLSVEIDVMRPLMEAIMRLVVGTKTFFASLANKAVDTLAWAAIPNDGVKLYGALDNMSSADNISVTLKVDGSTKTVDAFLKVTNYALDALRKVKSIGDFTITNEYISSVATDLAKKKLVGKAV